MVFIDCVFKEVIWDRVELEGCLLRSVVGISICVKRGRKKDWVEREDDLEFGFNDSFG